MTRIRQAGAIVFRCSDSGATILLVRAKKASGEWIFPKGHLAEGESFERAALREAFEETGIRGVVMGPIGAPLTFRSGDEDVEVQYFLAYARTCGPSPEQRETFWCSPSDALATLTHDDGRALLTKALPEIARWTQTVSPAAGSEPFTSLMMAEFNHVADSLLRNEEAGERRVAFFLSLAGAVGATLAFLIGGNTPLVGHRHLVGGATGGALWLLGYATFVRVVVRNATSDFYKRRLARIRQYFLDGPEDPRRHFLPFEPFDHAWRHIASWRTIGTAGWLETVVLIESIVSGGLAAFVVLSLLQFRSSFAPLSLWPASISAMAGCVAGWITWSTLLARGNTLYAKQMQRRQDGFEYDP